MNKRIVFQGRGWDDYVYWQAEDSRTLKKINSLIQDIDRNEDSGIGKPEALSGSLSGFRSRRIDEKNRLVYRIQDNNIEIVQCRSHYDDK